MDHHASVRAALAALVLLPMLLGATPTPIPGGANQRRAVEGCMNQWLFNGIWRFRVTKVDPIDPDGNRPGYGVSVELRNGTHTTLQPVFTGADAQKMQLQLDDGNTIQATATTSAALVAQKLTYKELIQAGGMTLQLWFLGDAMEKPENLKKPVKLVYPIDASWEKSHPERPQYAVGDPTFRVDLSCGGAAA